MNEHGYIIAAAGLVVAVCSPLAAGLIWMAMKIAVLESKAKDHDEIIGKQDAKMDEILKGMNEIKGDVNLMKHNMEPIIKRIERNFG